MDAQQLATFQAVITEGSFDAAARALHLTPSAVSQRIKALEQTVGQVLVRRTRPATPTDAGQALVRLAGQIDLLSREALEAARGTPDGGRPRISVVVNADSLSWFLTALPGLPNLSFEIHQDDQDHTADLLRAGTVMAAVTAQDIAVQGCKVELLGSMRYHAMAAPGVFDGFGTTPMVVLNRKDRLQHRFLPDPAVNPPIHYVPAVTAFIEAVRLGLGWGMIPSHQLTLADRAGGLLEIVPGRTLDVPLHWQYWRLESTALTTLTTAIKTAAAGVLH